ncbi:MAG: hypothetical protein LBT84_04495, partial [Spirochaetia bacterium]|nr:hypothetical protein [Spirochaetia bacterium]
MIEDVMQRIDDIQKRFGLKKNNTAGVNEIKPSAEDFNAALQKAFGDAENRAFADAARDVPQKE